MADDRAHTSPAVRELLELWDGNPLAVWLEAQIESGWHRHTASEAMWPMPASRPT